MSARTRLGALWLPVCLLAAGCGQGTSTAPAPPTQNAAPPPPTEDVFKQTVPYDAPYYKFKKMEISGKINSLSLGENGGLPIKDFKINTYRLLTNDPANVTDPLEMTVSAPECRFNQSELQGSSAGPLTVETADGRFLIQGTGYLWSQKGTNATLAISNDVSTTIKSGLLATNAGNSTVPAESGGQPIRIQSREFLFDRNANLITYTNHVRAEDEQLAINCDVMNIHRSPEGAINDLVADGNIVIVDKSTGGRATGDHAVYTAAGGAQQVTLTGNPYWQNGTSEATAQAFIFDRTRRTFRMQGDAHAKLPPSSISNPGFGFMAGTGAATNAPEAGAQPVDLYASDIILQLPATTNGPIQGAEADGNVIIVDAQDNSRASGDHAVYTGSDGVLVLSGKAAWESGEGVVARAGELTFDRTNQTFAALTNAYLRFPAAALGQSGAFGNLPARNAAATNDFVEVNSDSYDYLGDVLTFRDHVNGRLRDGDTTLGTLESGILTVVSKSALLENGRRTNELESIVAEQDVHLRQTPALDVHGKLADADFQCARLEIETRTNDLIKTVVATGGVRASRNETAAGGGKPVRLTLATDSMTADFMPDTNLLQVLVADGKVLLTRDEERASGDRVIYTATNDTAVLTGNPRLDEPRAQMTTDDAIIYDRAHGIIRGTGNPRTMVDLPPASLSQSNVPGLPERKAR